MISQKQYALGVAFLEDTLLRGLYESVFHPAPGQQLYILAESLLSGKPQMMGMKVTDVREEVDHILNAWNNILTPFDRARLKSEFLVPLMRAENAVLSKVFDDSSERTLPSQLIVRLEKYVKRLKTVSNLEEELAFVGIRQAGEKLFAIGARDEKRDPWVHVANLLHASDYLPHTANVETFNGDVLIGVRAPLKAKTLESSWAGKRFRAREVDFVEKAVKLFTANSTMIKSLPTSVRENVESLEKRIATEATRVRSALDGGQSFTIELGVKTLDLWSLSCDVRNALNPPIELF